MKRIGLVLSIVAFIFMVMLNIITMTQHYVKSVEDKQVLIQQVETLEHDTIIIAKKMLEEKLDSLVIELQVKDSTLKAIQVINHGGK